MKNIYIRNRHPGEFLKKELLEEMNISQYKLAKAIDVPQIYISDIVNEKRGISHKMGLLLDKFFGFSEGYFSRLQNHYGMMEARKEIVSKLEKIQTYEFEPA